ncbi:MAG: hypothetical protein FH758_12055 [Firmicutes bacterium]|nr:hypothetical protein [Bacillota bacterium]
MNTSDYLALIKKRLAANFDSKEDQILLKEKLDLLAKSHVKNEKYFAVKNVKLWSYDNNEYCLFKVLSHNIERSHIRDFENYLKKTVKELVVNPTGEHFQTIITGVLLTNGKIALEACTEVEKFKYNRSLAWGFKGYCFIRLILVDLKKEQLFVNKRAKEVMKFYRPNEKKI